MWSLPCVAGEQLVIQEKQMEYPITLLGEQAFHRDENIIEFLFHTKHEIKIHLDLKTNKSKIEVIQRNYKITF